MTYKYYILKNRIADSIEAYTEYNERYNSVYRVMSETMKAQYIDQTYRYRFAIQF